MNWRSNRLLAMSLGIVSVGVLLLIGGAAQSTIRSRFPENDMGKDSLPSRQKAQMEAAKQFKVFHQFQFADAVKESGITFSHSAVDDVTKHMRMGHYDKPEEMNVALDEVQIGGREIGPGRRMLKRIGLLFAIGALGMVDPRRLDQQALVGGLQRSLLCRTRAAT